MIFYYPKLIQIIKCLSSSIFFKFTLNKYETCLIALTKAPFVNRIISKVTLVYLTKIKEKTI